MDSGLAPGGVPSRPAVQMEMGSSVDAKSWPDERFRKALQDALGKSKPGRKSKPVRLIFLGGVVCSALLSGGLVLEDTLGSKATIELSRPVVKPKPFLFSLPAVTVNLSSRDHSEAQVHVQVVVKLTEVNAVQRLHALRSRIVDSIYAQLWQCTADELKSTEGIEDLRVALTQVLNRLVRPWKVDSVGFRVLEVRQRTR